MAEHDRGDDVKIDVEALATDLRNKMSDNLSMSSRSCIFRVPNTLLRHNPKSYAPNAFSIGPFHYNKRHLKATEKIKLKYLHGLVSRFPDTNPEKKLMDLTAAITEVREEAREYYAGPINMSMGQFVKVLVLDGCFLIELFRKSYYNELIGQDDPIFGLKCMSTFLNHDLILLENQIPWLVLHHLFEETKTLEDRSPLNKLVADFFFSTFSRGVEIYQEEELRYENKHILDLLRNSMIYTSTIAKDERRLNCINTDYEPMPTATRLKEAGIKFKRATNTKASNILDINFNEGVLEIPQVFIDDTTEALFRNLVCLEQCLPYCKAVITSYVTLLDDLINTADDMKILCESKIIDNWLDIDDAAVLFNRLLNDTNMHHFYYLNFTVEVNNYCQRRWPRYRTVLLRDYFNNPWTLISVVAAVLPSYRLCLPSSNSMYMYIYIYIYICMHLDQQVVLYALFSFLLVFYESVNEEVRV